MWQKYIFIPIFFFLISGLAWWSGRSHLLGSRWFLRPEDADRYAHLVSQLGHPSKGPHSHDSHDSHESNNGERPLDRHPLSDGPAENQETIEAQRLELLEMLDEMAVQQHAHHSKYGRFTRILSQGRLSKYEIRVVEATSNHFQISAFSESQQDGSVSDKITVNQDFQVQSNFPLPSPRIEYLGKMAIARLSLLRNDPSRVGTLSEQTIFKGYLKFSVEGDPKEGGLSIIARGVMPPVQGLRINFPQQSPQQELSGQEDHNLAENAHLGGSQWNSVIRTSGQFGQDSSQQNHPIYSVPLVHNAVDKLVIEPISEEGAEFKN